MNQRNHPIIKATSYKRRRLQKRIVSLVMCLFLALSAGGKAQAAGAKLTLTATALGNLTMADGTPYKVLHASIYSQSGDSVEPGQIVYCVEPGVTLTILPDEAMGVPSVEGSAEGLYTMTSPTIPVKGVIRSMLGRILQVGGFSDPHTTVNTVLNSTDAACQAAAVQLLIWETVSGDLNANFELVATTIQTSRGFVGMSRWDKVKELHDQYLSELKDAHKLPSFLSASSTYAASYEQDCDTLVLVDENQVISKPYMHLSVSEPSVTMKIEEDTLTLYNPEGVDFEITAENSLCDGSKMPIPLITTSPSGNEPRQMTICPSAASLADPVKGFAKVTAAPVSIRTTAVSEATRTHSGSVNESIAFIKDTVAYSNVKVGKEYRLVGELMDKETKEALTDDNGQPITAQACFTPEKTSGSCEVVFEIAPEIAFGKTIVVFETLFEDQREVCVHADLEDEEQSVFYPRIQTTASVSSNKGTYTGETMVRQGEEEFLLTDTIEYESLCPGSYLMKTTLVDKESGESVFESETEFDAPTSSGSCTVEAVLSYEALLGKELVVFEKLYQNDVLIASHEDLCSKEQTISVPMIATKASAIDPVTQQETTESERIYGKIDGLSEKTVNVYDIVYYKGLQPGATYQIESFLIDQDDPSTCLKSQSCLIMPTAQSGEQCIVMEVPKEELEGKRIVFYEVLSLIDEQSQETTELFRHEDPKESNQQLFFPHIKTMAKDQASGTKILSLPKDSSEQAVIEDQVFYSGLKGKTSYQMKASVYDAQTGELLFEKEPVAFTSDESGQGSVTVELLTDLSQFCRETERKVTVFEELLSDDQTVIASHCVLADEDQSVDLPARPPVESKEVPKTGENSPSEASQLLWGAGILLFLSFAIALRKKQNSTES